GSPFGNGKSGDGDKDFFLGDFGNYLADLPHDHKDKGKYGGGDPGGGKGNFYHIGDDRYYHDPKCDPGDPANPAPLPPALPMFAAGLMMLGILGFSRRMRFSRRR